MSRQPASRIILALAFCAAVPAAAAAGFGVPPGDFWGHFRCTNGERTAIAEGGVMERRTGLTLPQCLERCSRTSGCVGISYVAFFSLSTGSDLDTQCTLLSKYVGRTTPLHRVTGDVQKTAFVCFTDKYKRSSPWDESDLHTVPERYREQFRPDVPRPGSSAPAGKYP